MDVLGFTADIKTAIRKYEIEHRLPPNSLAMLFTGHAGPFARLERGELNLDQFYPIFDQHATSKGMK